MERIGAGVSIVVLIVMVLPSLVFAQSKDEGERLWAEAYGLEQKAKTAGDTEAALDKYKQAIAIFEEVGYRKGVGRISNSAGYIYYSVGQYTKAIKYYENSLEIARKLDYLWGEGQTLNDIGLVYNSLGQYRKAIEYFELQTLSRSCLIYPNSWGRSGRLLIRSEYGLYDFRILLTTHIGNRVLRNNIRFHCIRLAFSGPLSIMRRDSSTLFSVRIIITRV